MKELKLSLCITNYNRTTMLLESFAQVLDDPRITDIIICDDNSSGGTIDYILSVLEFKDAKVRLCLMPDNVGMYENKKRAIEYASNEWCILFDSDNIITPAYIDAFQEEWNYGLIYPDTVYCPDFAKPQFNYTEFKGIYRGIKNVKDILHLPMFECLLNTCNYIVNREKYLEVWEITQDVKAADSIYFMYLWLKARCAIYVVPGMQYEHRVHDGSGFMQDVNGNMAKAKEIKNLIKSL